MDATVWLTYLAATIILSLTPGPGVFSSLSSGLNHGFRLGWWNALGMQAASMVYVAVVALGLGVILGATTFATDLAIMLAYTALAAKVFRAMRDPSRMRWVNRGLGGMFVAAGVALAGFRRSSSIAAA